ncbi:hypothetical protein BUALT_Bualt05G0166200 [Buddleja alternifolia]|uniref:Response regulatory domain-containing protein n=1 Tax=Buddleja alternifolia TaxID=168488 RepID=A0AAV6XLS1_9LAMI|nr:hypothetical protein BUALT_Bualt05G0166200 [Buddleja alternifolia]
MDSNGFCSPRSDCFPAGLRVLVVDDDPTWLKILEKMLKKCNYEGFLFFLISFNFILFPLRFALMQLRPVFGLTTCNLAQEALNRLRERKDGFDIVISDVNMPDMDGFKLLEHVGLEMDLPVIMMSVDGETSRVMKGVQHGACDYLLKPIRMKELRNIWQHVFRKRIHEVRDIEGHESLEELQMMRNGTEQFDDNYLYGGEFISGKKRKDVDNKYDERMCGDPSSLKKARVVWTVDLHQKFVKAVNQIGFENKAIRYSCLAEVGPKKILDLMGVPRLTRENVASHLQKYRLYLSRLQKENELKATLGGTKHSDFSPKDSAANACLQNPINLQHESFTVPAHKILVHNDDPKICEGNVKQSLPVSESKKSRFADSSDPQKSSSSRNSFDRSFGPFDSDVKSEPMMQSRYPWSTKLPSKQEHKPCFQFDHPPLPVHRTQADSVGPNLPHNPGPSSIDSGKATRARVELSNGKSIEKVTKVESTAALFSFQPEIESISSSMWNTKNHISEQNLFDHRNLILGTGSTRKLWDEEFNSYSSQGEFYQPFSDLGNIGSLGYGNQELIADVPPHLYDPLNFDFEYPGDPVEYPVIDQGLFA